MKPALFKIAIKSFFLGMVYIFIIQKISFEWDWLQAFLNIDPNFGNICFTKNLILFLALNLGNNGLTECEISFLWV